MRMTTTVVAAVVTVIGSAVLPCTAEARMPQHPGAEASAGSTLVKGKVTYFASDGTRHPARRITVEIRDADGTTGGSLLTKVTTQLNGSYLSSVPTTRADGTPRQLFVRALPTGRGFDVGPTPGPDAAAYALKTAPQIATGATQDVPVTPLNSTVKVNAAFSIADALTTGVMTATGLGALPASVHVQMPAPASDYRAGVIRLLAADAYDWDVVLHEYGHAIAQSASVTPPVGGKHTFFTNLSQANGKARGTRLAWSEGVASWLSVAGQVDRDVAALGIPRAGDSRYDDPEKHLAVDLAGNTGGTARGEDDEAATARLLWQVQHAPTLGQSFGSVFHALSSAKPANLSGAVPPLLTALGAASLDDDGSAGAAATTRTDVVDCLLTDQSVAPKLTRPAAGDVLLEDEPTTFAWKPGGGGLLLPLDRFVVQLWSPDWSTRLYQSEPVSANSWTPSEQEWAEIQTALDASGDSPTQLKVTVQGTNSLAPVTGPYRSCGVTVSTPSITVTPTKGDFLHPEPFGTCREFEDHGYLDGSNEFDLEGTGWKPSTTYAISLQRKEADAATIGLGSVTTGSDGTVGTTMSALPLMTAGTWRVVATPPGGAGGAIRVKSEIWSYTCTWYIDRGDRLEMTGWGGMGVMPSSTITRTYFPGPVQATATAGSQGEFTGSPYVVPCLANPMSYSETTENLDGAVTDDGAIACSGARTGSRVTSHVGGRSVTVFARR